jgi:hypothetical protein
MALEKEVGYGLVNTSATMSDVGTQCNGNNPLVVCSRMKWYRTSMCFVRGEMASVVAIARVLL